MAKSARDASLPLYARKACVWSDSRGCDDALILPGLDAGLFGSKLKPPYSAEGVADPGVEVGETGCDAADMDAAVDDVSPLV